MSKLETSEKLVFTVLECFDKFKKASGKRPYIALMRDAELRLLFAGIREGSNTCSDAEILSFGGVRLSSSESCPHGTIVMLSKKDWERNMDSIGMVVL